MPTELFGLAVDRQWEFENGFYITSPITRIGKLVAHFELYKSIVHLPGHVVECGVYKGSSLIRFATFRDLLESPYSRRIIGFDAFGKFPAQERATDQRFIAEFEAEAGDGIGLADMHAVFAHKHFANYELIQGDVCETIPDYIAAHPELKIALLHVDVDVYKPSAVILQHLYGRVVRGGLVVFDDYNLIEGETAAIDEFLVDRDVQIEKLPVSHIPSYIRIK